MKDYKILKYLKSLDSLVSSQNRPFFGVCDDTKWNFKERLDDV